MYGTCLQWIHVFATYSVERFPGNGIYLNYLSVNSTDMLSKYSENNILIGKNGKTIYHCETHDLKHITIRFYVHGQIT